MLYQAIGEYDSAAISYKQEFIILSILAINNSSNISATILCSLVRNDPAQLHHYKVHAIFILPILVAKVRKSAAQAYS